jgi:hypothetical protein
VNLKDEPLIKDGAKQLIVTAIAWLAAKYVPGLDLSDAQVNAFALSVLSGVTVVWSFISRAKVVPTSKLASALPPEQHQAVMAALAVKK